VPNKQKFTEFLSLNKILEKLGQNPQRSLVFFMQGLGLFAIGVLCIPVSIQDACFRALERFQCKAL